ncbi:MAG: Ig-like domain-containing protein [Pseudomonadota bacterium]
MTRILNRTPSGVLVGDFDRDQLLFIQDLNGDGDARDPGETSVFFDETNLSGFPSPTGSVFNVFQGSDLAAYVGDGGSDTVWRLVDGNGDGDALDAGEATAWFTSANASGLTLPTPNGIAEGPDGAIYIVNAGTGSQPTDAVYRTIDLNGDGDADDAGESSIWIDLQTLIPSSSAFDISFVGDVAFVNDTAGGSPNVIWRLEDVNGDGSISIDEASRFVDENMSFGAPVDFANAPGPDGSLYTLSLFPPDSGPAALYRLSDLNGSGQIDEAAEAEEVWNSDALPEGFDFSIGFSVATDEDGRVVLTANSFASTNDVVKLEDLNGDGDFLDAGETVIFGQEAEGSIGRGRSLAFYDGAPQPVPSLIGTGNQFSLFYDEASQTLYSTGANFFGQLGLGAQGFNIQAPQVVDLPEGETIVSLSAGQIHSTLLTEGGDVYSWGFNNNGSLGLGDEEIRTVPTKIEALDDETIVLVENGNGVSYAVTDTGQLYAWGFNTNGQLGLGDQDERLVPTLVDALSDEVVVGLSSGTSFTLVLTADGQVYGFGRNSDGQLGSPDGLDEDGSPITRVLSPVLTAGLPSDIVAITADTNTAYAVTSDGRVFGWGESRFGQLLQGADQGDGTFLPDTSDVLEPIELTALPPGVIDVKGGARWGAALTDTGDVWLWGPNDEGPTGGLDGDPAAESDASFFPTKITELDDVNIVEIQSGPNAVLARSDDGRIFTWGINGDGRLGLNTDGETVYFPVEIDLAADAEPYLLSASPSDNGRDVETDALLTLQFTEPVDPGSGFIRLVDRDTGRVTEINVKDKRLVDVDGDTVTVTPPEVFSADTRYAVEIDDGAFVDSEGQAYPGISEGDTSTFNFTVADVPAASPDDLIGTFRKDVLRGGADDDFVVGLLGNDIVSGGAGNDVVLGGLGKDLVLGGDGNDKLRGGFGKDILDGGAGNDMMVGGFGRDTFVFNAGNDTIRDFDPGFSFFFFKKKGDKLDIDVDGFEAAEDVLAVAEQVGRDVVFTFDEDTTLTLEHTRLSRLDDDDFIFG